MVLDDRYRTTLFHKINQLRWATCAFDDSCVVSDDIYRPRFDLGPHTGMEILDGISNCEMVSKYANFGQTIRQQSPDRITLDHFCPDTITPRIGDFQL